MVKDSTMTMKELRAWREKRGLSVTEAAAMFGYAEQQWRNYENGTTAIRKVLEMAVKSKK